MGRIAPFFMLLLLLMIIAILVVIGLCFGSFVNALVWRMHKQTEVKGRKVSERYSVSRGRSMCVHCSHRLHALDLLPIFSWLALRGKCRYCKKPISWQYPLVELLTAILFVLSYVYWPQAVEGLEIVRLGIWLACITGFMALIVYDLRWMLLPNKIIFALYGFAGLDVLVRLVQERSLEPLAGTVFGVLVGGGIFYVLFQISEGRWIGGGDVKLGFLLGALVGTPMQATLVLFIASLVGCFVAIPLLATGNVARNTRIPFGPFLIAAGIIVMLFGTSITAWYLDALTTY